MYIHAIDTMVINKFSERSSSQGEPDLLALQEESKIMRLCWDVLNVVTFLQSSLWASPHRPTRTMGQLPQTGLKASDNFQYIPAQSDNLTLLL